jgi:DNA-binding NarL/FixJ family response regulator
MHLRRRQKAEKLALALTPARRLVFDEILKVRGSDEIAEQIGIARATVRVHTVAILAHFGVCSKLELLAQFVVAPASTNTRARRVAMIGR